MGSPGPEDDALGRADSLQRLQAVTDAALSHLPLDELLDELLTRVCAALEADTCAVLLLDDEAGQLVARAAKGLEEEVEMGVRIPIGRGFAGLIAAERRSIVIEDVDRADIFNPILREKGIKSLLGTPLIAEGRLLGVVHVGMLKPRAFSQDDLQLLEAVAQRVALAIDRGLAYSELLRLTEAQRDFVALAAHELRSPAATIYGLAATMRARGEKLAEDVLDELRETLYSQADRLRRLVDQLLDLSRIDANTVQIARERFDLRKHLDQIVKSVAAGRRTDVRVDAPSELEVSLDPHAVERVVGNLVANALQYGAPPVTVAAERSDRHVRIRVEDEGSGVSNEFVPFLFERFKRSDLPRGASGTGLGLAIARSYARAHGGDLLYMHRAPTGSCFELVLPAEPSDTQAHFWRH